MFYDLNLDLSPFSLSIFLSRNDWISLGNEFINKLYYVLLFGVKNCLTLMSKSDTSIPSEVASPRILFHSIYNRTHPRYRFVEAFLGTWKRKQVSKIC